MALRAMIRAMSCDPTNTRSTRDEDDPQQQVFASDLARRLHLIEDEPAWRLQESRYHPEPAVHSPMYS
ncbi:hypothetical protein [Nocardia fusca]|uniref:hypothetical protein n=1 Tax=Nocardia fusca TaxID=941183 RepID=UPI0007A762D0|nr:hypothetical protein [Nocardia fusca]